MIHWDIFYVVRGILRVSAKKGRPRRNKSEDNTIYQNFCYLEEEEEEEEEEKEKEEEEETHSSLYD